MDVQAGSMSYLPHFLHLRVHECQSSKQRKDLPKLTFGLGSIPIRYWLDVASHVCSRDHALCISLRINKSLRERFPSGASLCKGSCSCSPMGLMFVFRSYHAKARIWSAHSIPICCVALQWKQKSKAWLGGAAIYIVGIPILVLFSQSPSSSALTCVTDSTSNSHQPQFRNLAKRDVSHWSRNAIHVPGRLGCRNINLPRSSFHLAAASYYQIFATQASSYKIAHSINCLLYHFRH